MSQTIERPGSAVGTAVGTSADGLDVTVTAGPAGTAHVIAGGEIDFHSAPDLCHALLTALTAYRGTITIDLHEVTFCDCAALNALLTARESAERAHRTLRISRTSRPVERLLRLTGTRPCLTAGLE
ncbi:hypothetical protein SAVIM338S_00270 [Streptomyces avidinii]